MTDLGVKYICETVIILTLLGALFTFIAWALKDIKK